MRISLCTCLLSLFLCTFSCIYPGVYLCVSVVKCLYVPFGAPLWLSVFLYTPVRSLYLSAFSIPCCIFLCLIVSLCIFRYVWLYSHLLSLRLYFQINTRSKCPMKEPCVVITLPCFEIKENILLKHVFIFYFFFFILQIFLYFFNYFFLISFYFKEKNNIFKDLRKFLIFKHFSIT